ALTMVETIVGELPWQDCVGQPESLMGVKEFGLVPDGLLEIFERMYQKGYEFHADIKNAFVAWLEKQEALPPEKRAETKEKPAKTDITPTPPTVDTQPAGSVDAARQLIQQIQSEVDKKPAPDRLLQINAQLAEIQKNFPGQKEIEGALAGVMIKVSELLDGED
ncbi:MAG: hypothetical protein V3T21_05975, partial [Candidatus Margulisiibacteriota bacterium]